MIRTSNQLLPEKKLKKGFRGSLLISHKLSVELLAMTFLFMCMALMVLQCHARILINQNHVEMEDFVNPPVKQLYRVALDETPSFAKGNKAMRDKLLLRAWMVSFKKVFYSFIQISCF